MSVREAFKGDYMGFTYNNKHSSELGIVRVSDGSRFNENLLPTMQDKTVQVPGGDGTYYFGSYYTQRQFSISFAFDDLTEQEIRQLKNHFGDKGVHDLIFDEAPYKIYSAKVTGTATLKYIPFAEGATNRLYKGEGTIQFTCYNPFARSRYKFLSQYTPEDFSNIEEWKEASKMLQNQGNFDYPIIVNQDRGNEFPLYNPGDKEADFTFRISMDGVSKNSVKMYLSTNQQKDFLECRKFTKKGNDSFVRFNSKTELIEGLDSDYKPTGNIYNEYIENGSFFKIPCTTNTDNPPKLVFDNISFSKITDPPALQYDYYYL